MTLPASVVKTSPSAASPAVLTIWISGFSGVTVSSSWSQSGSSETQILATFFCGSTVAPASIVTS